MKKNSLCALLFVVAWGSVASVRAQKVDSALLRGFDFTIRPEAALGVHPFAERKTSRGVTVRVSPPSHCNNAESRFFPPIFNQDGGSCAAASTISYMLTHELNSYRRRSGISAANQLCSHFPWLTQNSGIAVIAGANGVPDAVTYGGRTYSALLGNAASDAADYGWMNGYDRWLAAMSNRLAYNSNFPLTLESEQGREDLKWWLYNHNGDESFGAGGLAVVGLAATGLQMATIPSSPTNDELGVGGLRYIKSWGPSFDHAVTIVGYDDRIEFDLDGNGLVGERGKDEVGAWIVANSWGSGWANSGFVYVPYKHATVLGSAGEYWQPGVYHIRKDYRPLRTLKVSMTYNHRAQMKLSVGVSRDLAATEPEVVMPMHHFQYAGNGDVPMLGRWADGRLHEEPMEFGYDVTDLTSAADRRQPLKYFFIVETRAADATGAGRVHALSLMDYELDSLGLEVPFGPAGADWSVQGAGARTVLSAVVPGEPFCAPANLALSGGTLTWHAPQPCGGSLLKYYVYHNAVLIDSTAPARTVYAVGSEAAGNYQMAALYSFGGSRFESAKSNTALLPVTLASYGEKRSLNLRGGLALPGVLKHPLREATIEWQIRPTVLTDGGQGVGTQWGEFLVQALTDGSFLFGWNNTHGLGWEGNVGNSATTASGLLPLSQWRHVALVVKDSEASLYVQGQLVGRVAGRGYSGIGGVDTFYIGTPAAPFQGMIDEVRVWNVARTPEQLKRWATRELAVPTAQGGLLAYYRMDTDTLEGRVVARDCVGGHHAPIWGSFYRAANQQWAKAQTLKADFALPAGPHNAGAPLAVTDGSTGAVARWQWTAEGAQPATSSLPEPVFTFDRAGRYAVRLVVTDLAGDTASACTVVSVQQAALPEPVFRLSADTVAMDERLTLINDSLVSGLSYEWLTPEADVERARGAVASVSYAQRGDYTITLRATAPDGRTAQTSRTITVRAAAPVADFEVSPAVVLRGEPTYLRDKSRRAPTAWTWNLESATHHIYVEGQNTSLTTQKAGVYSVSLCAANAVGSAVKTQPRALIVCNADAGTALNFASAAERVETGNPFAGTGTTNYTIEFWACPQQLAERNLYLGESPETFEMYVNADGSFTFNLAGSTLRTAAGAVVAGEWHHYAVTFLSGMAYVYRDGELFAYLRGAAGSDGYAPQPAGGLCIGGERGPVGGMIDELRIWGAYLSQNKLRTYANAPLTDVAAARTGSDRLLLYYNFNQNQGDVVDASGRGFAGRRVGFGPDGDAWCEARGVFCLNFDEAVSAVTAEYLTNYRMPFAHTGTPIKQGDATRYEPADWQVSGAATADGGATRTQAHVNTAKGSSFCIDTGSDGFAACTNAKAWQTVELPAGCYTLSVVLNGSAAVAQNGVFLVAAAGDSLPSVEAFEAQALAYRQLSTTTATNNLSFVLPHATTVSLGLVCTLTGTTATSIKSFALHRADLQVVQADGLVNAVAHPTLSAPRGVAVPVAGGLLLSGQGEEVCIYSADGTPVLRTVVSGQRCVALPAGIYIVGGRKLLVR